VPGVRLQRRVVQPMSAASSASDRRRRGVRAVAAGGVVCMSADSRRLIPRRAALLGRVAARAGCRESPSSLDETPVNSPWISIR